MGYDYEMKVCELEEEIKDLHADNSVLEEMVSIQAKQSKEAKVKLLEVESLLQSIRNILAI